jgi:ferredoxin-NADP reductase
MSTDLHTVSPITRVGRLPVAPRWAFPALDRAVGSRSARVADIRTLAPGTVHLRVDRPEGFRFRAGQFALLQVSTPWGPDLRPLSLAGSPDGEAIEFATRVGSSAFKHALFSLGPGDEVKVSRPIGGLPYDPDRPAVLIAGGMGITPLRSLMLSAAAVEASAPIHLLFSNRHWDWIPFRTELASEERMRANLRITWIQTSPIGVPQDTNVHHGRITGDLLERELRTTPDAVFYVAGPAPMTADVTRTLRELGVPGKRVHRATQGRR